jgi:hypothetical protein
LLHQVNTQHRDTALINARDHVNQGCQSFLNNMRTNNPQESMKWELKNQYHDRQMVKAQDKAVSHQREIIKARKDLARGTKNPIMKVWHHVKANKADTQLDEMKKHLEFLKFSSFQFAVPRK